MIWSAARRRERVDAAVAGPLALTGLAHQMARMQGLPATG